MTGAERARTSFLSGAGWVGPFSVRSDSASWGVGWAPWGVAAGLLLELAACSAPTDVIAVADSNAAPATPDVGALVEQDNGALGRLVVPPTAAQPGDAMVVIVAGLPAPDWQGPTFAWPLVTPLRTFFADSSPGVASPDVGGNTAANDTATSGSSGGGSSSSGSSHDGSGSSAVNDSHRSALTHTEPAAAEREAFEHLSTADLGPWHDVQLVASTGDAAERLRALFATVFADAHDTQHSDTQYKEPSLVARDASNDRYLVILEADNCGMPADHRDVACSGDARSDDE